MGHGFTPIFTDLISGNPCRSVSRFFMRALPRRRLRWRRGGKNKTHREGAKTRESKEA